ncbi:MAG: pyridoxamine 5'-phosphate oxidase family protein [Myxococcota bacterium]|nr:pyridoxamine 5'-phosphate oxidase family protein [Myxococcota bacterium]
MSLTMTRSERESFLAGIHVGVIAIADPDPSRAPLTAPIWYDYRPDVGVWLVTDPGSRKGVALEKAGRFSLVAQTEDMPYKYVSVEGPIIETRVGDKERDLRPMARRYLGEAFGDQYTEAQSQPGRTYVMRPARWLSVDYAKLGS